MIYSRGKTRNLESWNFVESYGITRNRMESWNRMEFNGIVWNSMESYGIQWNRTESWNPMDFNGIIWNHMESYGIQRNLAEPYRILGSSVQKPLEVLLLQKNLIQCIDN